MKASYKKLWKLLIDREMGKTQLRKATGISSVTMGKMGRGELVHFKVLARICIYLNVTFDDIVEIVPGQEDDARD